MVELLIVIVILGILAAIVAFAIGAIHDRGQGSACKADRKSVEIAAQAYFAKNGVYPTTIQQLVDEQLLREAPGTSEGYTITLGPQGSVGPAACSG